MNRQIGRLSIVALLLLVALIVATTYWQTWASAGLARVSPALVFRQQDHRLRSLARLRGLFTQIERRA